MGVIHFSFEFNETITNSCKNNRDIGNGWDTGMDGTPETILKIYIVIAANSSEKLGRLPDFEMISRIPEKYENLSIF